MFKNPAVACIYAFVFAVVLLSACGQKGDLYLPDEPQATASERTAGDDDEATELDAP